MKDAIVFIESNTTTAELYIEAAREENLEPVIVVIDKERYPFIKKKKVVYFEANTNNLNDIINCFNVVSKNYSVQGVGSSSEYYIEIAARAARFFNLPAANPDAVKNCRDKSEQRKTLSAAGISSPVYFEIINEQQCEKLLGKIEYPVVVKPAFGSGSINVKLCTNDWQTIEHCRKLLEQRTNERGMPLQPKVLIEEYIGGEEYSVETFNGEIVGITKKYVSNPPCFIEIGHDYPGSTLTEFQNDKINTAVLTGLKALGIEWGPVHTELKILNNDVFIIEVNPRLAGGFIPSLIRLSKGIDLIKEHIKLLTGREISLYGNSNNYASIRFLIPHKAGVLKKIDNLEEVQDIKGVHEISLYKEFGTELKINGDFRDRIGHLIYCGDDSEYVQRKSDELINHLHVIVN